MRILGMSIKRFTKMITIDFSDISQVRYPQKYDFREAVNAKILVNVESKQGKEKVLSKREKTILLKGTAGLNAKRKVVFLANDLEGNSFHILESSIIWQS